ncbi:MAG: hypothetical protein J6U20_02810 [Fibrobacter sp.]|nr:hypothetical protein [Fibrobacter sp.]
MKISVLSITLACFFFLVSCSNSVQYSEGKEGESQTPEWTWVSYDSDALRISGRAAYGDGDYVVLSWSASAVTVGFVGTALEAKMRADGLVYLDVFVDGIGDSSYLIKLDHGDEPSTLPVVSGLPDGMHVVTLYKRSESNFGDWYFYGMRVLGQAQKKYLPAAPKRKIEFVGNSITCGADVLIPEHGMETDVVYESAYYSYAGQTAKSLNAEYHSICSSGRGIYLNCDGSKTLRLPAVYDKLGTGDKLNGKWDHGKWHPDVVVMNLGTNDFASGKNDSAHFVKAAIDFVQHIRSCHPKAKIVILDGPMLVGDYKVKCRRFLDVVKKTLESRGEKGLYRLSLEPKGTAEHGVYFHPNKEEATADAETLSAWMRSKFGWN